MTRIQNAGTEVVEAKAGAVRVTYLLSAISDNMHNPAIRCDILFIVLSCKLELRSQVRGQKC